MEFHVAVLLRIQQHFTLVSTCWAEFYQMFFPLKNPLFYVNLPDSVFKVEVKCCFSIIQTQGNKSTGNVMLAVSVCMSGCLSSIKVWTKKECIKN